MQPTNRQGQGFLAFPTCKPVLAVPGQRARLMLGADAGPSSKAGA